VLFTPVAMSSAFVIFRHTFAKRLRGAELKTVTTQQLARLAKLELLQSPCVLFVETMYDGG
jgi:hypothetical protein